MWFISAPFPVALVLWHLLSCSAASVQLSSSPKDQAEPSTEHFTGNLLPSRLDEAACCSGAKLHLADVGHGAFILLALHLQEVFVEDTQQPWVGKGLFLP